MASLVKKQEKKEINQDLNLAIPPAGQQWELQVASKDLIEGDIYIMERVKFNDRRNVRAIGKVCSKASVKNNPPSHHKKKWRLDFSDNEGEWNYVIVDLLTKDGGKEQHYIVPRDTTGGAIDKGWEFYNILDEKKEEFKNAFNIVLPDVGIRSLTLIEDFDCAPSLPGGGYKRRRSRRKTKRHNRNRKRKSKMKRKSIRRRKSRRRR